MLVVWLVECRLGTHSTVERKDGKPADAQSISRPPHRITAWCCLNHMLLLHCCRNIVNNRLTYISHQYASITLLISSFVLTSSASPSLFTNIPRNICCTRSLSHRSLLLNLLTYLAWQEELRRIDFRIVLIPMSVSSLYSKLKLPLYC